MNISQSESDRLIDLLFHLQDAGSLALLPAEPELVAVLLVPGRARLLTLEGRARGRAEGDGWTGGGGGGPGCGVRRGCLRGWGGRGWLLYWGLRASAASDLVWPVADTEREVAAPPCFK